MMNKNKILYITENLDQTSGWGRYSGDLISELNNLKVESHIVGSYENLSNNIEYLGFLPSPIRFKKIFFFSWIYALRIFFRYRKENIQVIHCLVEPYAFIAYLASLLLNRPLIISLHGTYSDYFFNTRYKYFQKLAYKKAEQLICVSSYTASRVKKQVPSDILVIPNGLKSVPEYINRENAEPIIISVGAIKPRKGYHIMIEGLSALKKKYPHFKYWIVGNTKDKEYFTFIKNLIKSKNLDENIIFYENISDEELGDLYKKSFIFLLTSISSNYYEGFGLVYLEANSYGLPVIGSTKSGAEEAIVEGYSGFLIDTNHPEEIEDRLEKLLSSDLKYHELSANAYQHAKQSLWKDRAKIYRSVYERLCDNMQ